MSLLKTDTYPLLRSPLQNYLKLRHHPPPLPFRAFSEQVQLQLDSLRLDIVNLSKSNSQKDNSSAAKLSGSNDRPPEPEGEKVNKTRSSQSPVIHHIPDSPNESEKMIQEKLESLDKMAVDARFKAQQNRAKMEEKEKELLPQTNPKDKGKQKIVFKSKKELAKEAQMEIDEELAKQMKAKELKSKQEKIKVIKPTNSFTPPSDLTKENWDIPAPPNGMKFNLLPSAIYPVEPDVDIEEVKKRFFLRKPIQVVYVWSKFKIFSIIKIDIRKFKKMPYAFFQGKRTDNFEIMFSEANLPKINQADIRSLLIWLKQRVSTDKAFADVLQHLRQYVLDMVIDFSVDWEIGQLGEKEAEEPILDLNMKNESPGNILKKPHRGVVFSSKGRLKFMRISQKHLFSSKFIQGIIGLLKRIGDQDESLRVKIIEELTWFLTSR
ncbi:unnamed protein product [Lactuca virosa]|uniref:Uncharacterized protein n=1 Tax=Lactuca virosa TaxID=75947 RepID=A0AAU9N381_9ASTR|nr:unnamed protein product [Lactuca virosa]